MMRLNRASTALLIAVAACIEPTSPRSTPEDPSAQKPPPSATDVIVVTAVSPTQSVARPDASLETLPSVRAYNSTKSRPVSGLPVLFTLMTPDGSVTARIPVTTGTDGVATLPAWKMGTNYGRYWAVAQPEGAKAIDFFVYVRGEVTAIYDLVALEGAPFPSSQLTSAHYVVFNDGTYYRIYNSDVGDDVNESTRMDGTYTREPTGVINFYSSVPSFFGSLLATGTPVNGKLRVTYTDFLDNFTEIYAIR